MIFFFAAICIFSNQLDGKRGLRFKLFFFVFSAARVVNLEKRKLKKLTPSFFFFIMYKLFTKVVDFFVGFVGDGSNRDEKK